MESKAHRKRSSGEGKGDPSGRIQRDNLIMNGAASRSIQRVLPHGHVPHVAIVGAGFAGLKCADVLSHRGFKVTIFEGRDRIGGRVHQISRSDHVYDLGPNWIHGTDHNPILDLAMEMKDATFSVPDVAPRLYDDSGNLIDADESTEYYGIMWGIIADAFEYSALYSSSIPSEESLMDYFIIKVKENGLDDASSRIVLQMARGWGDFVGEPIEKQSLKFFWLEECIEGENLFLASTYKAILAHMTQAALAKSEIHLSTKITSIISTTEGDASSVSLMTASTKVHDFDEVVLTCPLGWLKHNLTAFTPALPLDIIQAVNNISYGRLEKVYLSFPQAFWRYNSSGEEIKSFFSNFLSPNYTEQNPKSWTIECVSHASLPAPQANPTLLFYVHGPCAQHVTSLIDDVDPSSKQYYTRLNEFFAPYYSRLPNYEPSSSNCKPSTIIATNWQNDEFAGWGSYTTFQTSPAGENVQLDKDIEALRYGCPERRLWFAGEHTAPFVALGTTTGAYWSGQAVAERITAVYGMESSKGVEQVVVK